MGMTLAPSVECRRIGDRVVEQHRERREADRAAHVYQRGDDRDDDARPPVSARCGLPNRGCTAASACGRCRSRAIASVVRDTPRMSASSEPSAATAAPDADHRFEAGKPSGANRFGQRRGRRRQPGRTQFAQRRHRHDRVDDQGDPERDRYRAGNGAGGVAHLLTQGGDPGVARERKEQQPGGLQHTADADVVAKHQPRSVGIAEAEDHHHHGRQHGQHHRHDDPGEQRRLFNPGVVQRGQRHDRGNRDRVRVARPHVVAHGERHGRARGRFADDEAPARGVTPEFAEPLAAVDVGAAGLRIAGGQPGRRRGVAVGDDGRDRQTEEQTRACRRCRRCQCHEDPCADHRPEPDRHRIGGSESPLAAQGRPACSHRAMLCQAVSRSPTSDSRADVMAAAASNAEQRNGAERDERNGRQPSHDQRCLALIDEVLVADSGRCLREVSRESGAAVDLPAPLVVVVDEDRKP